jgi:hypothetical protein
VWNVCTEDSYKNGLSNQILAPEFFSDCQSDFSHGKQLLDLHTFVVLKFSQISDVCLPPSSW